MIKYLPLVILLTACGGSSSEPEQTAEREQQTYLVAGQSQTQYCDWTYLTDITGDKIINIGVSGAGIDELIALYEPTEDFDAVIFLHGETDGALMTYPPYYIERVEYYRELMGASDKPFLVSAVGRFQTLFPDEGLDAIRYAQLAQEHWTIVYEDAWQFREWGLLRDEVHYTQEGCELIMNAIIDEVM